LALGYRLRADGGNLRYTPAGLLPDDLRAALLEHKADLLAYLSAWNPAEAIRLECDADELIEKLGVDGRDPEIADAARRAIEAHHRHDMAGVRAAVAEVVTATRRLAAGRSSS
jgi:hypothetical protein